MQLQDGKLYETRDGRRFRVTKKGARFDCSSHSAGWFVDGSSCNLNHNDDLIREVEEYRWIPVRGNEEAMEHGKIYRMWRGHVQQRVTREKAQRLAPNYKQTNPAPVVRIDTHKIDGVEVQVHTIENRKYLKITTVYGGEVLIAV
jgi:hypothetical protein